MWQGEITLVAHVIHFLSFVLAVISHGWIKTNIIIQYIGLEAYPWLQTTIAWVAVYIAAMYILPKIGFWIYQAVLMDR